MKKTILLLAVLIILKAQPALKDGTFKTSLKGIVTGKVIDAAYNNPMEYVNVVLLKEKEGEMVNGTITNKEGFFEIKSVPEGKYELKVTFMGYKKKTIKDVLISNTNLKYEVYDLKLEQESVELAEAQVIGEKSKVEFKIDKKVINVAQNISSTGGSIIDILQNQPGVKIDQDGNVTLRGSSNFQVLMDGRPTILQGSDALKQIPANIVDNIEIITNPSAKYDSEGTSGIINILTKKITDNSFNGILNASVGSRNKYGGDFTFNYKTSDYNLSAGLDSRRNQNVQSVYFEREINNRASLNTNDVTATMRRDNYNFRVTLDYYLSDKNTLTLGATAGRNDILTKILNTKFYTNEFAKNYSSALTDDKNDFTAKYWSGNIFIDHKFVPKVSELTFDASLARVSMPSYQSVVNTLDKAESLRERENNTTRYNSKIRLNYTLVPGENVKLEAGIHTTLFYKDFILKDKVIENNLWKVLQNNDFSFKNNIFAAFITYQNELIGFDYQLGLRYEYNDRLLKEKNRNLNLEYAQGDFFPTFSMSRKLNEAQSIQLSYSRRIFRPSDNSLNPIEEYSDDVTVIQGNPSLRPEFTDAFELNYQNTLPGVFLTVQTYYRISKDMHDQRQRLRSDGKFVIMEENLLKNYRYGAEVSAEITPAIWLNVEPVLDFSKNKMEGLGDDYKNKSELFEWSARLNTSVYLSQFTRIMISAYYNSKTVGSFGAIDPFGSFDVTLRQEFFDKALAVSLRAQNLFNTTKFIINQNTPSFNSYVRSIPENPVINLSISYNFNNFKRNNRAPEKVDINVNSGF